MTEEGRIIYDKGVADGHRAGVQDVVAQDRERLGLVAASLLAQLISIASGDEHDCDPMSIGVAMETKMPRADGRCVECGIVATFKEMGVAEYQRVMENLRDINGDADDDDSDA